ncbi:endonuclease/exonuclease/phosphatase family protein [Streptomyces sp. RY43-2]|uniref:Endonuclease/exonuclease/phosphatase family protein n=1 Tax=Streptomyces macrolidinus TaxID=2952607 RepID=A0ABT0ZH45_9ACTN|nr:endonuclease/exonuclease/phosphatase family protein [Streptomyces macrolidinus]MCN9242913.1 endonuclease/exonuclease/phosphatase family protein [Streptomyces macrolidinus]
MSGRFGRRRRRVVSAVVLLLGLSVAVTVAQTARSTGSVTTSPTLTVATWNMCGVRQWHCEDTGSRALKRRELKGLATRYGARVVFLQEACAADVEAVRRELGPSSWQSAFRAYGRRDATGHKTTVRCAEAGQGAAGIAILSAYPLSGIATVPSKQPSVGVQRGILCAFVAAYDIRLCTAHLSPQGSDLAHPHWELRDDQLKALIAAVPMRRTVYGGDLNVDPPGARNPLAWVWPSTPYTVHRECDQASASSRSGRATHVSGHKLDHLFTGLPRIGCTLHDTGASDHFALLLRVRTV